MKKNNIIAALTLLLVLAGCANGTDSSKGGNTSSSSSENITEVSSNVVVSSSNKTSVSSQDKVSVNTSSSTTVESSNSLSTDVTEEGYGVYVNDVRVASFTLHEAGTDAQKEEYMAVVEANVGDVFIIKDETGTPIEGIWWENDQTNDPYEVKVSGTHTFYLKLYADGGITVWLNAPVDPTLVPVTVYYTNPNGWSTVNIHYWLNADAPSWPGVAMEYDEVTGYYFYEGLLPGTGIVFNNGSGSQTGDLKLPATGETVTDGNTWWALD